jgi:hypothetical protein
MDATDLFVVTLVVGGRLLLPLGIIRYPLPAILACLVLDGVDQTIFQTFTSLSLEGYQGYDKALDIYYLVIAYTATLRNWTNQFAVSVGRFLIYYRLIGVVLFEATQIRALLMVFPNTFEYFFDFYEGVRVRWNPRRMSKALLIGATAFIWIVIKLPQEWWIHVAQLDMTDTIKKVLGGTPESSWSELIAANIPLIAGVMVVLIVLIVAAWWVITRKLPPADRPITFDADAEPGRAPDPARLKEVQQTMRDRFFDRDLLEKVVLISLVAIVFVQGLGFDADLGVVAIATTVIILVNTAVTEWLARRGHMWTTQRFFSHFVKVAILNAAIFAVLVFLLPLEGNFLRSGFLLTLLTLIVTMYDRYRPEYIARFSEAPAA